MNASAPLRPEDQAELAEMLEFVIDWLTTENETLDGSLRRFTLGLFSLDELTGDFARFAFALNGTTRFLDNDLLDQ